MWPNAGHEPQRPDNRKTKICQKTQLKRGAAVRSSDLVRRLWRLVPRRYRKQEWTLKRQTHQGANDSRYPAFNIWVRGNEWTEAAFLLGDLCTWNFKRDGWRLMVWSPNDQAQAQPPERDVERQKMNEPKTTQAEAQGGRLLPAAPGSANETMQIPKTPPLDWHIIFAKNLDKSIEFHRHNGYDPHGVSNAVILALTEVREMFGMAVCGQELPTPKLSPNSVLGRNTSEPKASK